MGKGYRLEPDAVRKIAMDLMFEVNPWDYGDHDDIGYLKASMYNIGVMEMAKQVIEAIEELKRT